MINICKMSKISVPILNARNIPSKVTISGYYEYFSRNSSIILSKE